MKTFATKKKTAAAVTCTNTHTKEPDNMEHNIYLVDAYFATITTVKCTRGFVATSTEEAKKGTVATNTQRNRSEKEERGGGGL